MLRVMLPDPPTGADDWLVSAPRHEIKFVGPERAAPFAAATLEAVCPPDDEFPVNRVHTVYFDSRDLAFAGIKHLTVASPRGWRARARDRGRAWECRIAGNFARAGSVDVDMHFTSDGLSHRDEQEDGGREAQEESRGGNPSPPRRGCCTIA